MVNLVIVSHSQRLAEGVKELAEQMAQYGGAGDAADDLAARASAVQIAAAGGICDEAQGFQLGTSAIRIAAAIEGVWTEAGVLILVDLGSAVLSAEMALELLPAEQRAHCRISGAPLVEGAVTAALEASLGHDLDAVSRAADSACQIEKLTL